MKVYLAGQADEHDNNWKQVCKKLDDFTFHDWEVDSDQTSPDTFFPDDLQGVRDADFMIANPGIAPSEGTWIEIGYFYATHTTIPGEFCNKLIIVWREDRNPTWSLDFVQKTGHVVSSVDEAKTKLLELFSKLEQVSNV